jgi:hypothetical protein
VRFLWGDTFRIQERVFFLLGEGVIDLFTRMFFVENGIVGNLLLSKRIIRFFLARIFSFDWLNVFGRRRGYNWIGRNID